MSGLLGHLFQNVDVDIFVEPSSGVADSANFFSSIWNGMNRLGLGAPWCDPGPPASGFSSYSPCHYRSLPEHRTPVKMFLKTLIAPSAQAQASTNSRPFNVGSALMDLPTLAEQRVSRRGLVNSAKLSARAKAMTNSGI